MGKPRSQILLQNALSLRKSRTDGVSRYDKRRRLLVVASLDDSVETGVAILVDFTALRVVRVTFVAEAKRFGRQVFGMGPNT
jgi:ABC-type xylose transport system permease subunit